MTSAKVDLEMYLYIPHLAINQFPMFHNSPGRFSQIETWPSWACDLPFNHGENVLNTHPGPRRTRRSLISSYRHRRPSCAGCCLDVTLIYFTNKFFPTSPYRGDDDDDWTCLLSCSPTGVIRSVSCRVPAFRCRSICAGSGSRARVRTWGRVLPTIWCRWVRIQFTSPSPRSHASVFS